MQVAIPDAEVAARLKPALGEFSPAIAVEPRVASPETRQASSGSAMDKGKAVRAALKAGVLGVFISIIPVPLLGVLLAFSTAAKIEYRLLPRSDRVSAEQLEWSPLPSTR